MVKLTMAILMTRLMSKLTLARQRQLGFTLHELMISLAIVSILGVLAMPPMAAMIATQRMKSVASDLYAALIRARSEAIKRNAETTLSPNIALLWQSGWSIPAPGNTAQTLADHGAIARATITGPSSVVYLANGRIKGDTAPSFDIGVAGANTRRCVMVDLSGRPYQKSSAC
ncbi:MAG: type IV fimbrial biogenesis protein FimT [Janthinobacterium sp.]|jgi:type IV fimbrial biogenesis protein FimT